MALTALCFLGLLAFSQAASLNLAFDPRIVNGENATWGEIPYQLSLQNKISNFHFCGAVVLNENYALTAAHCVIHREADTMQVISGSIDLRDPQSTHDIEEIRMHKYYNPRDYWINDIALIKVKQPFRKSANVDFVSLPPSDLQLQDGDVAVVSGWGRLWQGGPSTMHLQRVNIYISNTTACRKQYKKIGLYVYDSQVCAYDATVEKGSCHGDSGGPLTVGGTLVGLVSWGNGCASRTYPTVYTRVTSYLDWIQANSS